VSELERRDKQHDKQIKAIRNLVQEGWRIVGEIAREQRKLQTNLKELTNSRKRGQNGDTKRKVDLQ
jgi:hypothetical protein